MQEHPRETFIGCLRSGALIAADPYSIESVIIKKLPMRADINIVACDIDRKVLRNTDCLTIIAKNQ